VIVQTLLFINSILEWACALALVALLIFWIFEYRTPSR
jgi:hypothetical protein